MVIDRSYLHIGEDYDYYANSRDNFQAIYGNILKNEPGIAGRVLDIGCGHGSNPAYPYFSASIGQLDGVDPFPMVEPATVS